MTIQLNHDDTAELEKALAVKQRLLTLQVLAINLQDPDAIDALQAKIKRDIKQCGVSGSGKLDDEIISVVRGRAQQIQLSRDGLVYYCEFLGAIAGTNRVSVREGIVGPGDALETHSPFVSGAIRLFKATS